MAVKPILQALLLAERVFQDIHTKQFIIAGTFNHFRRKNRAEDEDETAVESGEKLRRVRPGGRGAPQAYLNLVAVRGTVELELRFRYLDKNKVLLRVDFSVSNEDPLRNVEGIIPLPSLPIDRSGAYALELLHKGEIIGACRLTATCDGGSEVDEGLSEDDDEQE